MSTNRGFLSNLNVGALIGYLVFVGGLGLYRTLTPRAEWVSTLSVLVYCAVGVAIVVVSRTNGAERHRRSRRPGPSSPATSRRSSLPC